MESPGELRARSGRDVILGLCQAGDRARQLEDWREALRAYQEALWECRRLGLDEACRARIHERIGDLQMGAAGEPEIARGYYEAAMVGTDTTAGRARLLCRLAETYQRSPRAVQYIEEAARLAAELDDPVLRAWTAYRRAEETPHVSHAERSRIVALGRKALAVPGLPEEWRELARGRMLAYAGELLDETLIDEQARLLHERHDRSWSAARHHYAVADGLRRVGRLAESIDHTRRSISIYHDLGRDSEETATRLALAEFCLASGNVEAARAECRWVLTHGDGKGVRGQALAILCRTWIHDHAGEGRGWAEACVEATARRSESEPEYRRMALHELGVAERILRATGGVFEPWAALGDGAHAAQDWSAPKVAAPQDAAVPANLRDWVAEKGSDSGAITFRATDVLLDAVPHKGFSRLDMPRITRQTEGDFVLEARIHGGQKVLADTLRARRAAGDGARLARVGGAGGLLVISDQQNALRMCAHIRAPGEVIAEVRQRRVARTLGRVLLGDGPLHLRIERRGTRLRLLAGDASGWHELAEPDLPDWGHVDAGVYGECPTDMYSIVTSSTTRFADVALSGTRGGRRSGPTAARPLAARPSPTVATAEGLLACSPAMERVVEQIRRVGAEHRPVLVCGETGTGKELVARAIHESSAGRRGPFIAINCAAMARELLERELFGHVRGAYTGAHEARGGLFEAAHKGTLFLDEIGAASDELQVRLLRVVEEQAVRPVGALRVRAVDVRIVSATNEDLTRAIEERRFRADLYYRLRGAMVRVPPLRKRPEDIPLMAHHALDLWAQYRGGPHPGLTHEAMELLLSHPWPGNVRELIHEVQEAASCRPEAPITPADLSIGRVGHATGADPSEASRLVVLTEALRQAGGNVSVAANDLGISRSTIYRWMRQVGLR